MKASMLMAALSFLILTKILVLVKTLFRNVLPNNCETERKCFLLLPPHKLWTTDLNPFLNASQMPISVAHITLIFHWVYRFLQPRKKIRGLKCGLLKVPSPLSRNTGCWTLILFGFGDNFDLSDGQMPCLKFLFVASKCWLRVLSV